MPTPIESSTGILCRAEALCQLKAPDDPNNRPCGTKPTHFNLELAERECREALQGRLNQLQNPNADFEPSSSKNLRIGYAALELGLATIEPEEAAAHFAQAALSGRQVLDASDTYLTTQLNGGLLNTYAPLFAQRNPSYQQAVGADADPGAAFANLLGIALDAPVHPRAQKRNHFLDPAHQPCASSEKVKDDNIAAMGMLTLLERETRQNAPRLWPISPRELGRTSRGAALPGFYAIASKDGVRARFKPVMNQRLEPNQHLSKERPNAPLVVNVEAATHLALRGDITQTTSNALSQANRKATETLEIFDALRSARPLTKAEAILATRMAVILQRTVSAYTARVARLHSAMRETEHQRLRHSTPDI